MRAIEEHSYKGIIDCVLANSGGVPEKLVKRYRKYGAEQVHIDAAGVKTVKSKLFSDELYARHDCGKLAKTLIKIINEASLIRTA